MHSLVAQQAVFTNTKFKNKKTSTNAKERGLRELEKTQIFRMAYQTRTLHCLKSS